MLHNPCSPLLTGKGPSLLVEEGAAVDERDAACRQEIPQWTSAAGAGNHCAQVRDVGRGAHSQVQAVPPNITAQCREAAEREVTPSNEVKEWGLQRMDFRHNIYRGVPSLTSPASAYERALAKYGRKLIIHAQKEQKRKLKDSDNRHLLERRKTIHNKYTAWSLQTATKKNTQAPTSSHHREGWCHQQETPPSPGKSTLTTHAAPCAAAAPRGAVIPRETGPGSPQNTQQSASKDSEQYKNRNGGPLICSYTLVEGQRDQGTSKATCPKIRGSVCVERGALHTRDASTQTQRHHRSKRRNYVHSFLTPFRVNGPLCECHSGRSAGFQVYGSAFFGCTCWSRLFTSPRPLRRTRSVGDEPIASSKPSSSSSLWDECKSEKVPPEGLCSAWDSAADEATKSRDGRAMSGTHLLRLPIDCIGSEGDIFDGDDEEMPIFIRPMRQPRPLSRCLS
uniref:Uncharacterized protein n=1 Tax=Trypanosoma congolense (strain IL3000) TaxID=1068625 RepID=G0UWN8_TRYCI|nr:conserved hypothetical protein [Trypanosoma congolense IL3000]